MRTKRLNKIFLLFKRVKVAASVIQSRNAQLGPGSSSISFFSNTTNGSTIVVAIALLSGTPPTFAVSDAINGSYDFGEVNSNLTHIKWKRNITGGFTQLNINSEFSDTNYYVVAWEIAGLDNSAAIASANGSDPGGTTNHNTSDTPLSGTGFAVCCNRYPGDGGTTTSGSGWTLGNPTTGVAACIQRKISTFVNDTGSFTTSSGIASVGSMAIFPEASLATQPFFTVIGAKRVQ